MTPRKAEAEMGSGPPEGGDGRLEGLDDNGRGKREMKSGCSETFPRRFEGNGWKTVGSAQEAGQSTAQRVSDKPDIRVWINLLEIVEQFLCTLSDTVNMNIGTAHNTNRIK